jgi:hypothetical protein
VGEVSKMQEELGDIVWYSIMKDSVNYNKWPDCSYLSNKALIDILRKRV